MSNDPLHQPHHTGELQQISFLLVLAAVTIMALWIAWPFATPLLWSALAAIMFQPLYKWSLRKCRGKRNPAALLTLTIILLAVILPALWVGTLVVQEALDLVAALQENPIDLVAWANQLYGMLPESVQELVDESGWGDMTEAQDRLQEMLGESAGMLASQAVSIGSGALSFLLSFGLGLYVLYFLPRDGSRIGEAPLDQVANVEKKMPRNFITRDGFNITDAARDRGEVRALLARARGARAPALVLLAAGAARGRQREASRGQRCREGDSIRAPGHRPPSP